MTLLDIARGYVRAGLSVIPILADGSKKAAVTWKPYQQRLSGGKELEQWFGAKSSHGIAIVGGKVSGGLEILDFDSEAVWLAWLALTTQQAPKLLALLPRVKTPSGGMHVYFRSSNPAGNAKLARAPGGETLIETRGEGGYVLAPGCPLACHPAGRPYELQAGPGLDAIPRLEGVPL